MSNPFGNIDKAFFPMFLDVIEISGVRMAGRVFKTQVAACVFPEEKDTPFTDTIEDTELVTIKVYVMKKCDEINNGWAEKFMPQIGDEIENTDSKTYKISEVKDSQSWFEITARSGRR